MKFKCLCRSQTLAADQTHGLTFREDDVNGSAFLFFGNGEDNSLVPRYNLLADRQPNPGAFVFAYSVQALKNIEDLFREFLIETDAVIGEGDHCIIALCIQRGMHEPHGFWKWYSGNAQ